MTSTQWQVQRPLGEGGTGQVWLARTPEGREVAVKILPAPEHVPLWEHEVRLLMRLKHPAVAAVLGCLKDSADIFGADRGPCFWMEYVSGDEVTAAAEKVRRDPVQIQIWLRQALTALRDLHAQDVLHGDLSPSNVRVDAEGNVRFIDFGTASLAGSHSVSRAATLLYLAPERIGGKNGPACDLYSLGVVFYEALAGIHPRAGARSLSEMTRKPAVPLEKARPDAADTNATLLRVLDRMILADPLHRFAAASEALEALDGGAESHAVAASTPYPVRMIGVDAHFEAVGRAIEGLGARSRLLAVHGVTGTGKKRFLREIGFQAAVSGWPARSLDAATVAAVLERRENPFANARGVVVFESVETLPPSVLASLFFHCRRESLPARGALAFLSWNEDGLDESRRRVLESLAAHPDVTDLPFHNLTREESAELLKSIGRGDSEEAVETAWRRSHGNPLLLLEGADSSLDERVAGVAEDERDVLAFLAAAGTPVGFEELARARGADAVEMLSVLDRLAAKGFAAIASETGRVQLTVAGIDRKILSGLAPADSTRIHGAWLAALGGAREDDAQKLRHAVALNDAAYIARVGFDVSESLRARRLYTEALVLAQAGLSVARAAGDKITVSRLLRATINLFNDLGRYREALGLCEEVRALAAADDAPEVKEAKYWLITGLIHQNLGDADEASRRFSELARFCGEGVGAGVDGGEDNLGPYRVRAHSLLGTQALRRRDLAEARVHFEAGLRSADAGGWRRAEICRNLGAVLHAEGDHAGAARLLEEAARLYAEENNEEGEYAVRLLEGNLALERGDFAEAEAAYALAETIAASRRDDLLFGSVWNNQGLMERKRGDLGRSLERLQKALSVFRPLGNWIDLAECLKHNAITEAQAGRFEAAVRHVSEIRALAPHLARAEERAAEAEEIVKRYRDGEGLSEPDEAGKAALRTFYDRLPKALQVSFEDRYDYKRWIKGRTP